MSISNKIDLDWFFFMSFITLGTKCPFFFLGQFFLRKKLPIKTVITFTVLK